VSIHVTTIRHAELCKYEKPRPKQELMDTMGYVSFLPKTYILRILLPRKNTLLDSSQVHYWDSINAYKIISTNMIFAISKQCNLSISADADCQKLQTYCLRLHFIDFAIANLFTILIVSMSH